MEDRYRMIRAYFEMLLAEVEATKDLPRDARLGDPAGKMKQFATWFTHGVPGGAKLRGAIYQARTGRACWKRWSAFSRPRPKRERVWQRKPMGRCLAIRKARWCVINATSGVGGGERLRVDGQPLGQVEECF